MWFHSSVNEPGGHGEQRLSPPPAELQPPLKYFPGGQLEHCSCSPVTRSVDQKVCGPDWAKEGVGKRKRSSGRIGELERSVWIRRGSRGGEGGQK